MPGGGRRPEESPFGDVAARVGDGRRADAADRRRVSNSLDAVVGERLPDHPPRAVVLVEQIPKTTRVSDRREQGQHLPVVAGVGSPRERGHTPHGVSNGAQSSAAIVGQDPVPA